MDLQQQQLLGSEIEARAAWLANQSIDIQFIQTPGLRESFSPAAVARSYDDARQNLAYLAESVSLGDPSMFVNYARWLDGILINYKVPPGTLAENFRCLKTLLNDNLGKMAAAQGVQRLDAAIAVISAPGTAP